MRSTSTCTQSGSAELMRFIEKRFPNFQVVATTHSPLTVHQAGEGELFFLRRGAERRPRRSRRTSGAPRNLMLHQLLASPVFGLDTLDSVPVEEMKEEYRRLRDKDTRSEAEERRLESWRTSSRIYRTGPRDRGATRDREGLMRTSAASSGAASGRGPGVIAPVETPHEPGDPAGFRGEGRIANQGKLLALHLVGQDRKPSVWKAAKNQLQR